MTEKISVWESSRENNIWWKFIYEEHLRKPFHSCNAEG